MHTGIIFSNQCSEVGINMTKSTMKSQAMPPLIAERTGWSGKRHDHVVGVLGGIRRTKITQL